MLISEVIAQFQRAIDIYGDKMAVFSVNEYTRGDSDTGGGWNRVHSPTKLTIAPEQNGHIEIVVG